MTAMLSNGTVAPRAKGCVQHGSPTTSSDIPNLSTSDMTVDITISLTVPSGKPPTKAWGSADVGTAR
eukprot:4739306-Alexandrium_andersonii.AAC.1